jgi:hypothetical protein
VYKTSFKWRILKIRAPREKKGGMIGLSLLFPVADEEYAAVRALDEFRE